MVLGRSCFSAPARGAGVATSNVWGFISNLGFVVLEETKGSGVQCGFGERGSHASAALGRGDCPLRCRCAKSQTITEEIGWTGLNPQSPSERWADDCA